MKTTIDSIDLNELLGKLREANQEIAEGYPGTPGNRQPVHSVYGGAQLFRRSTVKRVGEIAAAYAQDYLNVEFLCEDLLINPDIAPTVLDRVTAKLAVEAVEDFRIDFEDGFGNRDEREEDETACFTAKELAAAWQSGTMSPFSGIRIKSLGEETKKRSLRTLDLFLTNLVDSVGGSIPPTFVVTLPKVTCPEQVEVFAEALEQIEHQLGLKAQPIAVELMLETPQGIFDPGGRLALPSFVAASRRRCVAVHFGTYDYTACLDIIAPDQRIDHSSCDFAKQTMKVALAGTGIRLSDGATTTLPVRVYKDPMSEEQVDANRRAVHAAWQLSYKNIKHALSQAFFQGWDLHPGQIPLRYVTLYDFFLSGLDSSSKRLRNFIEHAAKATVAGATFDDAATGQGLLNYYLRAMSCGAIGEKELQEVGLTAAGLNTRSFLQIMRGRQKQ